MWALFAYTVMPFGALLVAMLGSGRSGPMWAAGKVLDTPIHLGNLQCSSGALVSAFCLALAYLSRLGMSRSQARLENAEAFGEAALRDQRARDVFFHERNLYMSLFGLMLWGVAWRLKVLRGNGQLTTPAEGGRRRPLLLRLVYLVLGLACLLLADIPLCRVNYNLNLSYFVTPVKQQLMRTAPLCEGIMMASAGGRCLDLCNGARKLSEERYNAIQFARNWHVLGRVAAELFDDSRGVTQGTERIDAFFRDKSCVEVLQKVDKSNQLVNYACITFAGCSIIGAFSFIASFVQEREEDLPPQDNKAHKE